MILGISPPLLYRTGGLQAVIPRGHYCHPSIGNASWKRQALWGSTNRIKAPLCRCVSGWPRLGERVLTIGHPFLSVMSGKGFGNVYVRGHRGWWEVGHSPACRRGRDMGPPLLRRGEEPGCPALAPADVRKGEEWGLLCRWVFPAPLKTSARNKLQCDAPRLSTSSDSSVDSLLRHPKTPCRS